MLGLQQKKILILSYENENPFAIWLAKALEKNGHQIKLVLCDPFTAQKRPKWFFDARLEKFSVETIEPVLQRLTKRSISDSALWSFINGFEKYYLKNTSFYQLMLTDPIISQEHHPRAPYYRSLSSTERYRVSGHLAVWAEQLIDEYKPDLVLSTSAKHFLINAFLHICASSNIRAFVYLPARYKRYYSWEAVDRLPKYRNGPTLAYEPQRYDEHRDEKFREELAAQGGLYPAQSVEKRKTRLIQLIKNWIVSEAKVSVQSARRVISFEKNARYKPELVGIPIFTKLFRAECLYRSVSEKVRKNICRSYYTDTSGLSGPYVLFPLHVLPESSVLTWGPPYYEIDIIKRLAYELPCGITILVKENPGMVELRSESDKAAIKSLPNVAYVDPELESVGLIANAVAVVGISGTALLEAALCETVSVCLGNPEFADCCDYRGEAGLAAMVNMLRGYKDEPAAKDRAENVNRYMFNRFNRMCLVSPAAREWLSPQSSRKLEHYPSLEEVLNSLSVSYKESYGEDWRFI